MAMIEFSNDSVDRTMARCHTSSPLQIESALEVKRKIFLQRWRRTGRKYVHISCWLAPLWGRWWTPGNLRRKKWRHLWALCPNQKRNTCVPIWHLRRLPPFATTAASFSPLKWRQFLKVAYIHWTDLLLLFLKYCSTTMNDFTLRSRFLRKRIRQWAGIPVVSWILFENFSSWGDF